MKATECKCCCCGEDAVAFWPIFDIDQETQPNPYCRKCLSQAKMQMLLAMDRTVQQHKKSRHRR